MGEAGGDALISRALDILISIVVLVIAAPFLAVAAIAIRLDSPGPVIYRQRRVGRDGYVFELRKLRTMVEGSDPVGVGTAVTAEDPRVTRVGQRLRRFSLDEIPNLINVLRGEMAIVGPRPTIEAQAADYTSHHRRRLEVKPGVTGWAQVNGRVGLPWEERIELDIWYVEHRSLWIDIKVLAKTAWLLVTGKGLNAGAVTPAADLESPEAWMKSGGSRD
jgi:lipopolysaccharide/colanic/teichoic acid biosynthesis glycosyltransferase